LVLTSHSTCYPSNMKKVSETLVGSHFAFGENWSNYAQSVSVDHLAHAANDLRSLLSESAFKGKRFCDIGCGSGIHSVAAAQMGAHVTAIDIDVNSTNTALGLARRFKVEESVCVSNDSIFDHSLPLHSFDIVYSWGVLHHTGDMWRAIDLAIDLVSEELGSKFVIALYRKTRLCGIWRVEKQIYSRSPALVQGIVRAFYVLFFDAVNVLRRKNPLTYRREYKKKRGMSFAHDVHDWLGGYPYESVKDDEVKNFFSERGFVLEKAVLRCPNKTPIGLFSSGCDEYIFTRS
jgi:2-polyprenyl-3-methyl-5-hydroxy-6-metoxy-1,4-benzoquinol methylase